MKILLTTPFVDSKLQAQYRNIPQLGIGYLAARILSSGFECEVVDAKMLNLSLNKVTSEISKIKPEILGISAMTHEIIRAHSMAEKIKKILPKTLIIIGGCHATALPVETLNEFHAFDFVIAGEGENTFIEFIKTIRNGHYSFSEIKGLAYRQNGHVIFTGSAGFIDDLDAIPFPAWQKFPTTNFYPVMTSRGCPFGCKFCMHIMGKKTRYRSPSNVVNEIERDVEKFNARYITFRDDTFTLDGERVREICDLIIKRRLNKRIECNANTNVKVASYEIFKKMKEAGFKTIAFGIESGNEEILRSIGKNINKEEIKKAVFFAKRAGLETTGYYILGHPHETSRTVWDTIKFAAKLRTKNVCIGIMVPYPGTEIFRMAKNGEGGYNLIEGAAWSDFDKYLGSALELEGLSIKKLEFYQMIGYLYFYVINFYFFGLVKFVIQHLRTVIAAFVKYIRK